ncbi:MAG: phage tail tape measure protein [Thalassobaculum sp.]
MFDNIRDFSEQALGDSFYDILRGETTDFAEFLETTLLRAIANVAAAAATQTFVMPFAAQVVGGVPGLFGLPSSAVGANDNGGVVGSIFGGQGGFNPLSSITNLVRDGITQGVGGVVATLAPAQSAAAGGAIFGAEAGIASQGALQAAGGAQLASSFLGPAALAAAAFGLAYQMGLIGPGPTSGPVGIADFAPGLGRDFQFGVNDRNPMEFLTADNGGNAEGMRPIAEAIADLIADSADRFAATIDQSLRFRVANYASPEAGNSGGRVQGFEVNAFIRQEAENRIAEGLDETQAIFEAFNFAVREAFTFESDTLQEIVRNTTAETTEDLLADLEFGRHFDMLSNEIDRLGGVVTRNTLAQAENTIAIQEQAEQTAEAAVQPIVDALRQAIELFPAIGGTGTASGASAMSAASVSRLPDWMAAIEFDRGAARGEPGYTFTRNANDNGDNLGTLGTPGGDLTVSQIGSDEYGGNFAVMDSAGDVIETFRTLSELLASADDIAADYAETVAAQNEALGRTAEEQARYDANMQRVGFQIDVARQQVSTLVDTITGDFEGLSQGPFATALATGQAELDALRDHLELVNDEIRNANTEFPGLNAALIDVTSTITDAQAALLANLQSDFQDSIQAQINSAQGNDFLNTVQGLLDTRATTADEAAALGLNVNDTAGALFSAQISNLLGGLTADQLQLIRNSFDDAALIGAIDQAVSALGGFADATTLSAQDLAAGVEAFTSALQAELGTLESATAQVSSSIRGLYRAIDSNLVDRNLSPLSPLQRLTESERQLMEAFALANDNTPDDIESREARDRLADLVQTDNELARDYYASSTAYSERFQRNQDLLRQTAVAQELLEQSMLSRLTEIRDLLAANDNGPGFGSTYSRLSNGQYVSDTGFDLGGNAEINLSILRALEAAGLATPSGFGEGQLNALRSSDSRVDGLLRQVLGYADGGAFINGMPVNYFANGAVMNTPTLFGMQGGLGMMAEAGPEAIMPLERINGVLGVRAILPSNDYGGGMSRDIINAMRADNAALRAEVALLREVVADGANVNAEATRGVSRTIDRTSRDARLRPRRGAAA